MTTSRRCTKSPRSAGVLILHLPCFVYPSRYCLLGILELSTNPFLAWAQVAEVLDDSAKWTWLQANVQSFIDQGDVLVFVSTKVRVEEISGQLQAAGLKCALSGSVAYICQMKHLSH